jgi:hypothetical protein
MEGSAVAALADAMDNQVAPAAQVREADGARFSSLL